MSAFFVLWEIKSSGLGFFSSFFKDVLKKYLSLDLQQRAVVKGYGAAAGLHIALIILQNYKNSYLKQRLTNEI